MIRTVITADKNFLTLPLPEEYVGKKIEVIAFVLEEEMENHQEKQLKKNM